MRVVLADIDGEALNGAAAQVAGHARAGMRDVLAMHTDVSRKDHVEALRDAVYRRFGAVHVLMNNAGTGGGGGPFDRYDDWQRVLAVNLWGVVHGLHAFTDAMLAQATPGAIVVTGSKQGLTNPPGDTAYNVSKAALRTLTEGLAHRLRTLDGCQISAHLLVPGYTFTGLTGRLLDEKPAAAWWPDQVADTLIAALHAGRFYILCADNSVDVATDHKRLRWTTDDILQDRPALSRWHPDYAAAFADFMARKE